MTTARERELRKLIKDEGLAIVSLSLSGAGNYRFDLRAPGGEEKMFVFSKTSGDLRAMRNNRSLLRQWTRTLPVPAPAPAASPVPPSLPKPQYIPMPPARLAPIVAAAEIAAILPAPAPVLPATTTQTMTTPAPKKRVPPTEIARLSNAEFYKLCEWLKTADLAGIHTYVALAQRGAQATGLQLTQHNVRPALETVGRELPLSPARQPKPASPNERVLAQAIIRLMESLGLEPGEDLRALAA